MNVRDLLERMVAVEASDLHLKVGSPPGLRIHGKLEPIEGWEPLDPAACRGLIAQILDDDKIEAFDHDRDIDLSISIPGLSRFRVNVFHQRGTCAAVLRTIPLEVPSLEEMGYADIVRDLCEEGHGLTLVTGPTGSGKSTTLAAMIDYINRNNHAHILTLEDPIEFMHSDKKCFVNQREIGADTKSFATGLRAALREDPDYILVGEMRDQETISLAITAAETGHMVFGTLHTPSAIQTVDRMIDVFPHDSQAQIRTQLSITLQAVISQTLLPKIGGGRACAQEVMVGTDAVRNCIREGKTPQLINMLQTGQGVGMQTLEMDLAKLVKRQKITAGDAMRKANYPHLLRQRLEAEGVTVPDAANGPKPAKATKPAPRPPKKPASPATPTPPGSAPPQGTGGGGADPFDNFEAFRASRKKKGRP